MKNVEISHERLELNLAQQAVWLDAKLTGSSAYQLGAWVRLPGSLDPQALRQTLSLTMARHEALRLRVDDEMPAQWLDDSAQPPLHVAEIAREEEFEAYVEAVFAEPMPLGDHPLFRVDWVRVAGARAQFLLFRFHHLIADSASVSIAMAHWIAAYEALTSDTPKELTPPSAYSKTIAEDAAYLQSAACHRDLAYWTERFDPLPPPLLADLQARPNRRGKVPVVHWRIEGQTLTKLREGARAAGSNVQRALFALFALALGRRHGQTDIVCGMALHRRSAANRDMIGMLSGVIGVRCAFEPWWSLEECVQAFSEQVDADLKHQRLPLDVLSRELGLAGRGRAGLFEVAMSYLPAQFSQKLPEGVTTGSVTTKEASPISLHLTELRAGDGLMVRIAVNPDFLEPSEPGRLMALLQAAVGAFNASGREIRFEDLPGVEAAERRLVVEEWNRTAAAFPQGTLDGLFEEQARKTPAAIAVIGLDGREWSYAELDHASSRVARYLAAQGIGPEQVVGVRMQRSAETIVALLGILKAGGVYLPLDPAYPAERLDYMASNAGAAVVLHSIAGLDGDADLPHLIDPNRAAYIIYTSGTTGLPKGVAVTHVAPVNLAFGRRACHDPIGPGDRILAAISVGFDVSIGQLLLPLLSGATVVIADEIKTMGAAEFWTLLAQRRVTHINSVPSFFDSILDSAPPSGRLSLKRLMLGGEALSGALVARIGRMLPGVEVVNMYGPTEACIDATYHLAAPEDLKSAVLPIGRPLPNYRAYVLDEQKQPVGVGVSGELYLGGAGLARGYVNAPELTAERFVTGLGERLYRTGDRARWRADGRIEFLGRIDQQVKIRGFRVEPGEIATVLLQHPDVAQAVVAPRGQQLIAYFVPRRDVPESAELRAHLARRLPDYMVPAAYVPIASIPLNANGKLDVKALPAPELSENEYLEPRTGTEELLAGFFAEVLGVERCGALDNFFELGGHSLLATRLVSKIHSLGVNLPLRAVFENPTVEALARAIEAAQREGVEALDLGPRPAELPLSFPQERIWFVDSLQQDASYNIPVALELRGGLDAGAVERAIERIVQRHEALRTRFVVRNGQPVQEVDTPEHVTLPRIDLTGREQELHSRLERLAGHRFDLAADLPFQAELLTLAPDRHVLAMVIHHVAFDGWSAGVFYREFGALYQAFAAGQPDPLPAPPLQYPDFALWQRRQNRDADLAYWLEELRDAPPRSELPGRDLPAGEFARVPGAVSLHFDAPLHAALLKLARDHNASLFMVLHAAFSRMLARWNGQDDIVIGTVVANRRRAEFESVIGCFVNTVPLRTRFQQSESFSALLSRVAGADLNAFAHQDLPFEQLFASLGAERSMQHTPVFQTMFILQNTPPVSMELPGVAVNPLEVKLEGSKFDLMLLLGEEPEGLRGVLEFAANRFEPEAIERFSRQFHRMLEAVAADPSLDPGRLDLLDSQEKARITGAWNQAPVEFPRGTLDGMFASQAAATPQALAVVDRDGRELTYAELAEAVNGLAANLVNRGVGPERIVGVRMERSAATIVAMLAILKAGGAYLPLDPAYPAERLDYMAADAGAMLVLESIDGLTGAGEVPTAMDDQRLAYIIYTSGTTGRPKGVAVPHASAVNLVHARSASYDPLGPGDRVLAVTSVSFDMSIEQLLFPLLRGAAVVVAGDVKQLSAEGFWSLVARQRITHIDFVPSFLESIFDAASQAGPLALKRLMLGGEAVSGAFLARIQHDFPGLEVVNVYGPTETCIDATYHVAGAADVSAAVLPIGRPLPNYTAYVLDGNLQLAGAGIAGELYIGGAGLARGYVNAPELTAARFVADPFSRVSGARLYRTGDRARWRDDGVIEFLGRADEQVKIRGFRVELGEISAALLEQPNVAQAAVIARTTAGQTRLVAFVVAVAGRLIDPLALRSHLAQRLPEHMLPASFVTLAALPLNSNGKLDVRALPPDSGPALQRPYEPPQGSIETALQRIWETLLPASPIGRRENFFELGGQSLTAIRLIHAINTEFGVDLPMRALFEHPTIEGLAMALGRNSGELRTGDLVGNLAPLQTGGGRPNLFCIHPGGGHVFCYFPLTRALGPEQPVYGIQAQGLEEGQPLPASIEEMAASYIALLEQVQPQGPYQLLGMSLGGLIAFEMARQLQASGRQVALLALLDTTIPEDITVTVTDGLLLRTLAAEFGLDDLLDGSVRCPQQLLERALANRRLPPGFTAARASRIAEVFWNMVRLQLAYHPQAIEGPVLSVRALRRSEDEDILPDWSRYVNGTVEVVDLDCSHHDLVTAALAPTLAEAVSQRIGASH